MTTWTPPTTQLWVETEGASIHYACGTAEQMETLGERMLATKVCLETYTAPCCQVDPDRVTACSLDVADEDETRKTVILAWSFAGAEGREIDPPYRCPVHRVLTFGGCCSPDDPQATQPRMEA
jgi:hypothetical protein